MSELNGWHEDGYACHEQGCEQEHHADGPPGDLSLRILPAGELYGRSILVEDFQNDAGTLRILREYSNKLRAYLITEYPDKFRGLELIGLAPAHQEVIIARELLADSDGTKPDASYVFHDPYDA